MIRGGAPLVAAVVMAGALTACGSAGTNSSKTATVDAASSLTKAFTTLGQQFEQAHPGEKVRFNFGGSDTLAAAITSGAPVDAFAAASPTTMATVTAKKDTVSTPTVFVRNQLEIAVPTSNPAHVASLADTVKPGVKLILCAAAVPCGAVAEKVYAAAHLTPHPVSLEQQVTAVLTTLELDQADAGLVYKTDVLSAQGKVTGIPIPAADQAITSYPIAVTKNGHARTVAQQFVQYVLSPAGRQVLSGDGFLNP